MVEKINELSKDEKTKKPLIDFSKIENVNAIAKSLGVNQDVFSKYITTFGIENETNLVDQMAAHKFGDLKTFNFLGVSFFDFIRGDKGKVEKIINEGSEQKRYAIATELEGSMIIALSMKQNAASNDEIGKFISKHAIVENEIVTFEGGQTKSNSISFATMIGLAFITPIKIDEQNSEKTKLLLNDFIKELSSKMGATSKKAAENVISNMATLNSLYIAVAIEGLNILKDKDYTYKKGNLEEQINNYGQALAKQKKYILDLAKAASDKTFGVYLENGLKKSDFETNFVYTFIIDAFLPASKITNFDGEMKINAIEYVLSNASQYMIQKYHVINNKEWQENIANIVMIYSTVSPKISEFAFDSTKDDMLKKFSTGLLNIILNPKPEKSKICEWEREVLDEYKNLLGIKNNEVALFFSSDELKRAKGDGKKEWETPLINSLNFASKVLGINLKDLLRLDTQQKPVTEETPEKKLEFVDILLKKGYSSDEINMVGINLIGTISDLYLIHGNEITNKIIVQALNGIPTREEQIKAAEEKVKQQELRKDQKDGYIISKTLDKIYLSINKQHNSQLELEEKDRKILEEKDRKIIQRESDKPTIKSYQIQPNIRKDKKGNIISSTWPLELKDLTSELFIGSGLTNGMPKRFELYLNPKGPYPVTNKLGKIWYKNKWIDTADWLGRMHPPSTLPNAVKAMADNYEALCTKYNNRGKIDELIRNYNSVYTALMTGAKKIVEKYYLKADPKKKEELENKFFLWGLNVICREYMISSDNLSRLIKNGCTLNFEQDTKNPKNLFADITKIIEKTFQDKKSGTYHIYHRTEDGRDTLIGTISYDKDGKQSVNLITKKIDFTLGSNLYILQNNKLVAFMPTFYYERRLRLNSHAFFKNNDPNMELTMLNLHAASNPYPINIDIKEKEPEKPPVQESVKVVPEPVGMAPEIRKLKLAFVSPTIGISAPIINITTTSTDLKTILFTNLKDQQAIDLGSLYVVLDSFKINVSIDQMSITYALQNLLKDQVVPTYKTEIEHLQKNEMLVLYLCDGKITSQPTGDNYARVVIINNNGTYEIELYDKNKAIVTKGIIDINQLMLLTAIHAPIYITLNNLINISLPYGMQSSFGTKIAVPYWYDLKTKLPFKYAGGPWNIMPFTTLSRPFKYKGFIINPYIGGIYNEKTISPYYGLDLQKTLGGLSLNFGVGLETENKLSYNIGFGRNFNIWRIETGFALTKKGGYVCGGWDYNKDGKIDLGLKVINVGGTVYIPDVITNGQGFLGKILFAPVKWISKIPSKIRREKGIMKN